MTNRLFYSIIAICLFVPNVLLSCGTSSKDTPVSEDGANDSTYVLVIHGGAGGITKKGMTPEREKAYKDGLREALTAGYEIISNGGSSLDAVEAAARVLEDNEMFNSGRGAVFTNDGKNELDASIMDGKTLEAGAVASVTTVKNPISAARAVMEKSKHVMLIGKGAELFAGQQGLEIVDPSYFYTEHRWEGLQRARAKDSTRALLDHDSQSYKPDLSEMDNKFGTIGAVARDLNGNLAAATSTGGMVNKRYGRVGDSPIVGAGMYANNETVAVSATGWGEFFIRSVAAYDVSAKMAYQGLPVQVAAQQVIDKIGEMGGHGGIIAIDKDGRISMPFNTKGMYRGAVKKDGTMEVEMYK